MLQLFTAIFLPLHFSYMYCKQNEGSSVKSIFHYVNVVKLLFLKSYQEYVLFYYKPKCRGGIPWPSCRKYKKVLNIVFDGFKKPGLMLQNQVFILQCLGSGSVDPQHFASLDLDKDPKNIWISRFQIQGEKYQPKPVQKSFPS